eukprot:5208972-Alexandrium_andersonii.AAC.1
MEAAAVHHRTMVHRGPTHPRKPGQRDGALPAQRSNANAGTVTRIFESARIDTRARVSPCVGGVGTA